MLSLGWISTEPSCAQGIFLQGCLSLLEIAPALVKRQDRFHLSRCSGGERLAHGATLNSGDSRGGWGVQSWSRGGAQWVEVTRKNWLAEVGSDQLSGWGMLPVSGWQESRWDWAWRNSSLLLDTAGQGEAQQRGGHKGSRTEAEREENRPEQPPGPLCPWWPRSLPRKARGLCIRSLVCRPSLPPAASGHHGPAHYKQRGSSDAQFWGWGRPRWRGSAGEGLLVPHTMVEAITWCDPTVGTERGTRGPNSELLLGTHSRHNCPPTPEERTALLLSQGGAW